MHFGNFGEKSVMIGKDRTFEKKFRMPFGKRRVHSVSCRHHDDRWQNAPCIFRKASEAFYSFQSLPSCHGSCRSTCRHRTKFFEVHCRSACRHRTKFFEVHYTSVTLRLNICAWEAQTPFHYNVCILSFISCI